MLLVGCLLLVGSNPEKQRTFSRLMQKFYFRGVFMRPFSGLEVCFWGVEFIAFGFSVLKVGSGSTAFTLSGFHNKNRTSPRL